MQTKLSSFWYFLALFSVSGVAQELCFAPIKPISLDTELETGQIRVTAQNALIQQDTLAEFNGNVEIDSQDSKITANSARVNRSNQSLNASGQVTYQDRFIKVSSESVDLNTTTNELLITDTHYQLTAMNGRGDADTIALSQDSGVSLQEVSFTTCPEGHEDWRIQASTITLSPDQNWGEMSHARFYIQDVPVLYLPYFAFPVTDARQSGLLYPMISSSTSTGVSYEQPYYWNIAENMDATIAPRLMSQRGLQLKTEFRYLSSQHNGQVDVEYLANDRATDTQDARYFYRFVHQGALSENWQVNAEYNGLSDSNYIVDLGSDYYSRADTHLYQTLGVSYYDEQLDFSLQFRDFEILGEHANSYRALPEMKLNYESELALGFEFGLASELAYFDNNSALSPQATRLHIAPTLRYPYQTQWGEFLAETTLLQTYYRQDNIDNTELSKDVSRTLGQARLFGALAFERSAGWLQDGAIQTLEPKVQYLYTSFERQTDIGLYDTTRLFSDFEGLFRGQKFTGLDRISDKNQLTVGLTTRLLDKDNNEKFALSFGQIFYIQETQVAAALEQNDRSALAAELDWQIGSKWYAHTEAQISSVTDKVERSSFSLEYTSAKDRVAQINHRYVRELSGEEINQVGITTSWPINQQWHWVGRWYRDVKSHRTVETYAGLQYESCCWAVRLVAQRHLSNRYDDSGLQSTNEFESGITLQFILKGMGGKTAGRDMLTDGLFGYRRPYLLN
ncbi:LPS-assembly protein LptD [Flavobacterium sp. W21_SRS_FM6]|uniref:LPS-assembly protein LptD n=1 Tax=Flavobacterium sp. W21_SRS_FM6 TaxID=3240268 RepID=UPI003F8E1C43